jgi:AcrR family transcriptional regulator
MADRKIEILEATCRVIAREGTDGLRMGTVAIEAGVSSALIHYYFATRDDLLAQAFNHADTKADLAAAEALAGIDSPLERLRRLLLVYSGDDVVFREDWVLWVEMWRSAIFDERLAENVRRSNASWMQQIEELIEEGAAEGLVASDVNVPDAALRLAAVVDGLGLQILPGVLTRERAAELIVSAIDLELGVLPATRSRA